MSALCKEVAPVLVPSAAVSETIRSALVRVDAASAAYRQALRREVAVLLRAAFADVAAGGFEWPRLIGAAECVAEWLRDPGERARVRQIAEWAWHRCRARVPA